MHNLLNFIKAHYHWFILLILEAISFTLLFTYNSYQGAAWISTANSVAGFVYEVESNIASYFNLKNNNALLTSRNIYLQHQVLTLTEELERQGYDSLKLAGINNPAEYNVIPAQVVQNSVNQRDNLMTINKGAADGVKKDMGVVCGTGVVGIVYLAGKHYSVVIPALSSKSSISCKIEKRGYLGYLHWTGGHSSLANVDDVPRHAHFKLYERVVTSGYSSVFPEGIPVGKILHVFNSPDGVSYRLQVQLYTDFSKLRDVCVIDNSRMHEQLEILRAAQDSLTKTKQ